MAVVSEASTLVTQLLSSRKNANKLVDLIILLDMQENEETITTALNGLKQFFSKALKNGELRKEDNSGEKTEQYRVWLKLRYQECVAKVTEMLGHTLSSIKQLCLETIIGFIEEEIGSSSQASTNQRYFPESLLEKLLEAIIMSETTELTLTFCKKYWDFEDIRFFVLKCIPRCLHKLSEKDSGAENQKVLHNTFLLLESISECMPTGVNAEECKMLIGKELASAKYFDIKEHRRVFGLAWLEFLKHDLTSSLFKSVLVLLQKQIIPHFASPCLLADFLTRSFKQGGGMALLSLHGLFILMNEHNLEYPEFYTNLYGMVHPRIFDAKYQARFFYLLEIFLSSSHLPAYLIAAFAKKLARLALIAPTYAVQLIITFIYDLLENNPSIQFLVNQKNRKNSKEQSIQNDPFCASQIDPALCKAMESSLWEFETLKKHYLPSIVKAMNESEHFKSKPQIQDYLGDTFEETFMLHNRKDFMEAPMNHIPPDSIFGGFEDAVADLWSV